MLKSSLPRSLFHLAVCAFFAGALTGCGSGGDFATAPAKGIVTCSGQPLTGGTIYFSPIGTPGKTGKDGAITGKPATGEIQSDGTFILTTYRDNDGAVVGKHRVTYSPPVTDGPTKKLPCAGAAPQELEVKSGTNEFKIEL